MEQLWNSSRNLYHHFEKSSRILLFQSIWGVLGFMFFTRGHGDDGFYRQKGEGVEIANECFVEIFREIPADDVGESNIPVNSC